MKTNGVNPPIGNFTKVSHSVLGNILPGKQMEPGIMADLTGNEFKLYMFVFRVTVGFGQENFRASYEEVAGFIGISKSGVDIARKGLIKKDLVDPIQDGGVTLWQLMYEKLVRSEADNPDNYANYGQPVYQKLLQTVPETTTAVPETTTPTRKETIKETIKEKEKKQQESPVGDSLPLTDQILKDSKSFGVKEIQEARFTTPQYKLLLEIEAGYPKPRKTLIKYIKNKLTGKPKAVEVYHDAFSMYPEKIVWSDMGKRVGNDPIRLEVYREALKIYVGKIGHKYSTLRQLDYFDEHYNEILARLHPDQAPPETGFSEWAKFEEPEKVARSKDEILWAQIQVGLRGVMTQATYDLFFAQAGFYVNGSPTIIAADSGSQEMILNRLIDPVTRVVRNCMADQSLHVEVTHGGQ